MRQLIALLLVFSLSFSQTVVVPIPGQRQEPPSGGGGGSDIGAVVGVLIGAGILFLITKAVLSKPSQTKRLPFIPFQFIALHRTELPPDLKVLESVRVEDITFSLLEWKEEEQKLRERLSGKVQILQPNYTYELMGKTKGLPPEGEREKKNTEAVAVLDTGADPDLLKGALLFVKNMRSDPYRAEAHGTAVAYLVHRAGGKKVALYRVCSGNLCDSWSIIKALAELLREDIRVVNMSFGTRARDRAVEVLIKLLSLRGFKFVAPVGNEPSDLLPFPARLEEVVSVAGAPCFPEKVCLRADVRERFEFSLPFGSFRGTSFASAFYAGTLLR